MEKKIEQQIAVFISNLKNSIDFSNTERKFAILSIF